MSKGVKRAVLIAGVAGGAWALFRAYKVYAAQKATADKTAAVVSSAITSVVGAPGVNNFLTF